MNTGKRVGLNQCGLKVAWGIVAVAAAAGCSDPSKQVPAATVEPTKSTEGAGASGAGAKGAADFVIRAESKIEFVGSKVTGSHSGGFTNFSGVISVAGGEIVGQPEVKIAMASTWSDNERLTGHLKAPDFFDVAKFPVSSFTVAKVEGTGAKKQVNGTLTLHGVSKAISFPASVEVGADAVTLKSEFSINRKDFGIVYPGKPDDLIRDGVVIKLDLKATPGPARPQDGLVK